MEGRVKSGTLGATFLGFPVIVARAGLFVAIGARGHTQTLRTTFLAEKHAGLLE